MGKLTEQTEATRILQAMKALQLITRGEKKSEALAMVGLSPAQFDTWLSVDSSAIEALQKDINEAERIRIAQIVSLQSAIMAKLESLITQPLFTDVDAMVRLMKLLLQMGKELEGKHGVHSASTSADEYLLQGPTTRQEESKMGVEHEMSRATVNIKTKPDGSVDLVLPVPQPILDIFPQLETEADKSATSKEKGIDLGS